MCCHYCFLRIYLVELFGRVEDFAYLCNVTMQFCTKLKQSTFMKDLKGTKTEKNLLEAFAGESMARNKYTYWASKAKKDGFVQIAAIFEETTKRSTPSCGSNT